VGNGERWPAGGSLPSSQAPSSPLQPPFSHPPARPPAVCRMFTVPSLRARECTPSEKDALNILFLAIPLLNVLLPFVSKSFPVIFSADCVLMAAVYASKGLIPGLGGSEGAEGEGGQQ
jgi:hypothetical protein